MRLRAIILPVVGVLLATPAASVEDGRRAALRASFTLTLKVDAGERVGNIFGPGFHFRLEPDTHGWNVVIHDEAQTQDISRLTPPLHGINPRQIYGWHFRNADNTGPNEPGEKNVNAPGKVREFFFSPEVGLTLGLPGRQPTWEEITQVQSYGRARLEILDYGLTDLTPGEQAKFAWMRFKVQLSWPPQGEAEPAGAPAAAADPVPAPKEPKTDKKAVKKKVPIWWEFSVTEGKSGDLEVPFTEVWLVIADEPEEKLKIGRYMGNPHIRQELEGPHLPKEARRALLNCMMWYAGGGDELYVFQTGRSLLVKWRPIGEGLERPVKLKTLKTKKFSEDVTVEGRR
jgi:hypothetical protein